MMYIHHKKITKGNFETNGQCGRPYYANSVDITNAVGIQVQIHFREFYLIEFSLYGKISHEIAVR